MQESLLISQLAPRLNAQNEVEATLMAQSMGQILPIAALSWRQRGAISELSTDAVVANYCFWRKVSRQKLQIVSLTVAHVKHAHSFERVESRCLQSRIVVQLQLENVFMLAQH